MFPTQPREKRGSQFLGRPQGLHACLLLIKYNAPLPSQDSRGSRWHGPLPLQTLQSSLPFPAHRSSPAAGAPDCIALWGAALASACLATSSGRQDYFLLPQLPLNMSVGVFQPIFNQRCAVYPETSTTAWRPGLPSMTPILGSCLEASMLQPARPLCNSLVF